MGKQVSRSPHLGCMPQGTHAVSCFNDLQGRLKIHFQTAFAVKFCFLLFKLLHWPHRFSLRHTHTMKKSEQAGQTADFRCMRRIRAARQSLYRQAAFCSYKEY